MKNFKNFNFLFILAVFLFFGGIIKANATDFSAMFDEMFASNTFTIYTDVPITDDDSLSSAVGDATNGYYYQEYWNSDSDYSYIYLSVGNCQFSTMSCGNFNVTRNKMVSGAYSYEDVATYNNVAINVVTDVNTYFPMVDGNNIPINYDEDMFNSDEEKANYISSYISSFGEYDNTTHNSINYSYNATTNVLTRTEYVNSTFSRSYRKKITSVVFSYVESAYSDAYSRLTNNGTVTINTDAEITSDLLSSYLNRFSTYSTEFRLDSSIKNNKVFIKKCDRVNDQFQCNENHLVTLNRNTNIGTYFTMVDNSNNVVIDYSDEMFETEDAKNNYILNYFNSFNTYIDNNSTSYSYDSTSKIISRVDYHNNNPVAVYYKTINDVVFGFEETAYSDVFKTLTTDGNLTIKSDIELTTDILGSYLQFRYPDPNNYNKYFSVDGQISNNKVFIKLCEYVNGSQQCNEKHIVSLIRNANIDLNKFSGIGAGEYYDIKVPEPQNKSQFFNGYQSLGTTNITINNNNDNTRDYFFIQFDYNSNYNYATVRYIRYDSNDAVIDTQFHRVAVRFLGYDDNVSETFAALVGNGIVINADYLDDSTIRQNIDSRLHVLNCSNDYSSCDVGYTNYQTSTVEIHRVNFILNSEVSNEFKTAFNLNNDGSIDVLKDQSVDIDTDHEWLSKGYYNENNNTSLNFNCFYDECTLIYKNYSTGYSESHSVEYNFVNSDRSDYYNSQVKDDIEVYPGEMTNVWSNIRYSNSLFNKGANNYNVSPTACDIDNHKCTIPVLNSDNKIEIHNTNITLKDGRSPEFDEYFPGDTLSINSIYSDSSHGMFLEDAAMGYLVSKTKTWSYLTDYSNNTAKVVYNGFETHTMNIEYVEEDQSIKQIVDEAVERINTQVENIVIDDLEFINVFYYQDNSAITSFNSSTVSQKLSEVINNKHISYFFADRCGDTGPFGSGSMGGVVLYYDGIAYGRAGEITKNTNHILYIPDNTEETTEAYIAAAQARIDEYLGENSGLTVSYYREASDSEVSFNLFEIDPNNFDGKVYKLKYEDREQQFLIVKDSSKMKTSTFNANDASSNVTVTSDDANYPTNTIVSFENADASLQQYQQLLAQLGLTTAQIINVDLYSPTIGNINQFNNVTFNVSFPINIVNYQNKNLYAYFIGPNGVEEHPITIDDFLGTYSTTHFSTYIISEKVETANVTNVAITSSKDSVNFGELEKGFTENSIQKVVITNTGDVPVTLSVTTIPTGDGPFGIYAIDEDQQIAPNGTMEISLIAKSSSPFSSIAGDYSGVYEITATEVGGTRTAKVSVTANAKIVEPQEDPVVPVSNTSISYTTHVQDIGWQEYVSNGEMAGTEGQAKRLEGIKIKLIDAPYAGDIEYRTHIQNIGWESAFKKNDEMSGTSGQALRLEAIEIKLTGEMANHYDIYYRVHAQNFGWLGWARNGEQSGTAGYAYRLEGIEIKLVAKGTKFEGYGDKETFVDATTGKVMPIKDDALVAYTTHVENIGWQPYVTDGKMAGTQGQALRLEGIKIKLVNQQYTGDIEYRTHIQNIGWETEFKKNDDMSGTSGRALRLEAIEIKLTGEMADHYDIYYRVHAQNFGWLGWAKNGEQAGTAGFAYRLEGIEIKLVPKGENPSFINGLQPFYKN